MTVLLAQHTDYASLSVREWGTADDRRTGSAFSDSSFSDSSVSNIPIISLIQLQKQNTMLVVEIEQTEEMVSMTQKAKLTQIGEISVSLQEKGVDVASINMLADRHLQGMPSVHRHVTYGS